MYSFKYSVPSCYKSKLNHNSLQDDDDENKTGENDDNKILNKDLENNFDLK